MFDTASAAAALAVRNSRRAKSADLGTWLRSCIQDDPCGIFVTAITHRNGSRPLPTPSDGLKDESSPCLMNFSPCISFSALRLVHVGWSVEITPYYYKTKRECIL